MTELTTHPKYRSLVSARDEFPALSDMIWFNNGIVSITPQQVTELLKGELDQTSRHGPPHVMDPDREWGLREASLTKIAHFAGAERDQVALMRGVSEGFQTILRGIDWRRGDRLIISEDEEAAILLPALYLREALGVDVVRLPYHHDPDEIVVSLARLLSASTRLVALSRVTTNLGWLYPIWELTKVANARGVPLFADLAHSSGVLTDSVEDLGCDFAGLLSYKWMFGPYASGLLYVRPDALTIPKLRYPGGRSEESLNLASHEYTLHTDARRFQYGAWTWVVIHGWAHAIDFLSLFDQKLIMSRTLEAVEHLHQTLSNIRGVTVLSSRPPLAGPLVSFSIEGVASDHASDYLWERYGIRIKAISDPRDLLRASIPFFILDTEIDRLVTGVADLAR